MDKKNKDGKYFEEVERYVNSETGEVIEEVSRSKRRVRRDKFIGVYLEEMKGLLRINTKTQYHVMCSLWERATYNTGRLYLVKSEKEEIAVELGLEYKTVDNCISQLCKKQLLIREARSKYILNPKYYFKGVYDERVKLLKVVASYELEDIEETK